MAKERKDWRGMGFILDEADSLDLFLSPKHVQRAKRFLSKKKTDAQWNKDDWQVCRLENGEIFVLYSPKTGVSFETCKEFVARYGTRKGVTGYTPWPWLDDPFSVLVYELLRKKIAEA